MEFLIGLGVIIVIGLFFANSYNSFVSLRNRVEEAFSTMDVFMMKRYDLIPNLVETVKGYTKHEQETLEKVIQARNMAVNASSPEDKMKAEGEFSGVLSRLFALSEAYPDLKANQQFLDLQSQLKLIEDDIAQSRKFYNGTTRQYNTTIETFPNNIIAGIFKFTRKPLFEVEDPSQRQNVKVQF
ncbi:MAG: LemA family protein [Erysipelotrichaceae bacterium]|nr:LemA family protein [Erysipelothrix sp.]MCD8573942.1 LemA family protein [Erysipelotrichaceae bacterium]